MAVLTQDRRGQIHRAACALFRERGFHGTSVRDIGEAVGMLGGSLYSHIESKDDLLWEIVNTAADRFLERIRTISESNLGVMQKLRAAVIAHVEEIAGDIEAAAVYTVEWRHLEPKRRKAVTARRDEYEQAFRALVEQAMRERFISSSDPAGATLFILSSLNGVYSWYRRDGRMTPTEVGQMLSDYVFDGLKRRMA
jgi:AcrR family transcriptional regulator